LGALFAVLVVSDEPLLMMEIALGGLGAGLLGGVAAVLLGRKTGER
jgi:hypothetical protein